MNMLTQTMTVVALLAHGLIHVMGLVAYTGFGSVPDLPYKTTVLGGWIDLGSFGTALFGALWGVAAIGFVAAAAGIAMRASTWRPLLSAVTALSALLTLLDLSVASAGLAFNVIILVALWIEPTLHAGLRARS
jgi:hypothetical protein